MTLQQAKTERESSAHAKIEITRPDAWLDWDVTEAHLWLRRQLGLPRQPDGSSTLGFLGSLFRVWDAPRPEFWPTLTWDLRSHQLGAEMDEEVLAALPGILRAAEGKPEYQQLWWA